MISPTLILGRKIKCLLVNLKNNASISKKKLFIVVGDRYTIHCKWLYKFRYRDDLTFCLCKICENCCLLVKGLNDLRKELLQSFLSNYHDSVEKFICNSYVSDSIPDYPMGIARPRNLHGTSLLGPSSMYHIVRPLDFLFQSTAAVSIEDLSGRPMDVQRLHKVEQQISHMWLYCSINNY